MIQCQCTDLKGFLHFGRNDNRCGFPRIPLFEVVHCQLYTRCYWIVLGRIEWEAQVLDDVGFLIGLAIGEIVEKIIESTDILRLEGE